MCVFAVGRAENPHIAHALSLSAICSILLFSSFSGPSCPVCGTRPRASLSDPAPAVLSEADSCHAVDRSVL